MNVVYRVNVSESCGADSPGVVPYKGPLNSCCGADRN